MEEILSKIEDPVMRKQLEFTVLYSDETKDQYNTNCNIYIVKDSKVFDLSNINIVAIKKDGKGFYYNDDSGELKFRKIGDYKILFEVVSKERKSMEDILKKLDSGEIIIKKKKPKHLL
jgi:hypothetical protein